MEAVGDPGGFRTSRNKEFVMKRQLVAFSLLALTAISGNALAMPKDGCGGDCGTCHSLTLKEASTLLKGIGGDVKEVKPSPVRGLWEVGLANQGKKAVVYVDYSKKFIVNGGIFDIATRKAVSGGPQQPKVEKVKVSAIPTGNSIVLGNPLAAKRLFLFTDPDCPFCAKQHAEIRKLLAKRQDIAVYVKLNPLKIHPNSYDHARLLLQSQSPQLLDDAYSGKTLPATCGFSGKMPCSRSKPYSTISPAALNNSNAKAYVFQSISCSGRMPNR